MSKSLGILLFSVTIPSLSLSVLFCEKEIIFKIMTIHVLCSRRLFESINRGEKINEYTTTRNTIEKTPYLHNSIVVTCTTNSQYYINTQNLSHSFIVKKDKQTSQSLSLFFFFFLLFLFFFPSSESLSASDLLLLSLLSLSLSESLSSESLFFFFFLRAPCGGASVV